MRKPLFGRTTEDVLNDLDNIQDIPGGVIQPKQDCEPIAIRDNFFHTCWLRLKLLKPDLAQEMQEVELFVAGYDSSDLEEKEEDDDSEYCQIV